MALDLDPSMAEKLLDFEYKNIAQKVAAGKTLTVAERARVQARAAGSTDSTAYAKTVVELAALLGVTRRTITAWRKLPGAPAPTAAGAHPVAEWREFVRVRGLKGGHPAHGNEEALKARKLLAEVEERELKVAIRKGDYVLVSEVREAWTRLAGRARARLETRLLNELPPVLSGKDAHGIRRELESVLTEAITLLHQGKEGGA